MQDGAKNNLRVPNKSIMSKRSHLELLAKTLLEELKVPFEEEYRFDLNRKWRLDFAFPQWKIAIEVEGGVWSGGRHTRGIGYEKDCEKYNALAMQGWMLYRFTGGMVEGGEFSEVMKRVIHSRICKSLAGR